MFQNLFNVLIQKQKDGFNNDSTTAEGDSKGALLKNNLKINKTLFSEEKESKSIMLNNRERLQSMINTPREEINHNKLDVDMPNKKGKKKDIIKDDNVLEHLHNNKKATKGRFY